MKANNYLSVKEYAAHIGVTPKTVYLWIKNNDKTVNYIRLGGTIRIKL